MNKLRRIKTIPNRITSIISISLLLIILFSACDRGRIRHITILHTNDIHGQFIPETVFTTEGEPSIGGFAALSYYIEQIRSETPNVILVDAGDFMTGNIVCDIGYKNAEGGALIEMMNMLGYDAGVCGNHEFDKPINNIKNLMEIADFPILCANLSDDAGNDFVKERYHILEEDGLKIGIIGVTLHPLEKSVSSENLEQYHSSNPAETINDIASEIDSLTDIIIALTHLGVKADRKLAMKLRRVDVIIGGHSHTVLEQPERVNGILIVQAGSHGRYLGRLDITAAGDTIKEYAGQLIPVINDEIETGRELGSFIDSFTHIIDNEYGKVIGVLKTDWVISSMAESNLGNWLTDAIRIKTGADVSFINSGGIRKNLKAGPIKLKDIMEISPFFDYVEVYECTGDQLMTTIMKNAEAQAEQNREILQVSGLRYSWKLDDGWVQLSSSSIGGKAIDFQKVYKVAALDYVIGNHDKYLGFKPDKVVNTNILISDMLIEAVKEAGEIDSKIEGRIRRAR
ncbi:MAG: 5'-nucleotidase C-terminal domain-containing protein [candidate division Zixibacteria bacterium]|nr:5'-nucleotidase C-terminal domain-containing protein [candidate division Zixibacteria bacterium]